MEPDAAKLFDDHAALVLAVCRSLLRDSHEAQDAAQETFLAAHRAILGGTRPRQPSAWLVAIARNQCRARMRKAALESGVAPEGRAASSRDSTLDEAARRADVRALRAARDDLPSRQREAVVLRDFRGLAYDEVAAAIGVSRPAVDSLLWRGRRLVAERMRAIRNAGVALVPGSVRDALARTDAARLADAPDAAAPGTAARDGRTGTAKRGRAGAARAARIAGRAAARPRAA